MYQTNSMVQQPQFSGGGGWKALQLLGMLKGGGKTPPVSGQQAAAFNQGAGPVSQAGAEQFLRNSFNAQTAYIPGNPYNGYPSMQSVFDRIRMGRY